MRSDTREHGDLKMSSCPLTPELLAAQESVARRKICQRSGIQPEHLHSRSAGRVPRARGIGALMRRDRRKKRHDQAADREKHENLFHDFLLKK